MPQLTPEFDKDLIYALSQYDTHFNNTNYYKEMQLMQEARTTLWGMSQKSASQT
jgi:hypothetical protein